MNEILSSALLIIGATFALLAGVGVLRMPDLFMRMQASTKASTLGIGCIIGAVAIHFGELSITTRAVAIVLFIFLLNFRTTLITLTAIPLSIVTAALVFKWFGM